MFNNTFRKSCRLCDDVEKYDRAGQTTDVNMIRCMHFACWIWQQTHTLRICNNYCFFHSNNGYANVPQYYVDT